MAQGKLEIILASPPIAPKSDQDSELAVDCDGRRGQQAFDSQQLERQTMKSKILVALVAIAAAFNWQAEAQTYDTNGAAVQTFAGSGFSGYVDGVGQQTMFNNPNTIVADSYGNLFVWDDANIRIRKITPGAIVTTFAGGAGWHHSHSKWKPWLGFVMIQTPIVAPVGVLVVCAAWHINPCEESFLLFAHHPVLMVLALIALILVVQPLSERNIRKLEFEFF